MLRFESYKLYKSLTVWLLLIGMGIFFFPTLVEPIDHVVKSRYSSFEGPATKQVFEMIKADSNIINNPENVIVDEGILYKNEIYAQILHMEETQIQRQQHLDVLKRDTLEQKLVSRINLSSIHYHDSAEIVATFVNQSGLLFPLIGLLLLSISYTRERMTGVEQYQLTSRNGRHALLRAKWIAAVTYVTVIHLLTYLATILVVRYQLGPIDWSAPMQAMDGLAAAPYPLSIGGYVLCTFIYQELAFVALATAILCASLFAKQYSHAFVYVMVLIGLPLTYGYVIPEVFFPDFVQVLIFFFPSRGVLTRELFQTDIPFVLPVFVMLVWMALVVTLYVFMMRSVKRRELT
ncbi:hypothetical protein RIF24_06650 [Exiguobacterium acetylicum]|uniref:hypothetical protein n=1 Tax=Exiguobacterium acetylicum TaxID=41170 RepID=UPI0039778E85